MKIIFLKKGQLNINTSEYQQEKKDDLQNLTAVQDFVNFLTSVIENYTD